jgi:hypothetical protein
MRTKHGDNADKGMQCRGINEIGNKPRGAEHSGAPIISVRLNPARSLSMSRPKVQVHIGKSAAN